MVAPTMGPSRSAVEQAPVDSSAGTPKKMGFLARIRGRSKRGEPLERLDNREQTPAAEDPCSVEKEDRMTTEQRVVTPPSTTKDNSTKNNKNFNSYRKRSKLPFREEVTLDKAPTAREAAFGGPPRYDWIDIETAAAIKVQAAFRRNKVMAELEQQGVSTAAIRNRSRRRKAWSSGRLGGTTDDVPSLFRCCGIGLAFGDATEEDYEEMRQHDKALYEERKKAREERELQLRSHYRRKATQGGGDANPEEEAYEIVE